MRLRTHWPLLLLSLQACTGDKEDPGGTVTDDTGGAPTLVIKDADGDGADAPEYGGDDCDDSDPEIYPDQVETWYDGIDSDCDGESDYDADGDSYDSDQYGGEDCDDTDLFIRPGVEDEPYDGVDQDCDGSSDFDGDQDGYDSAEYGGDDCDDTDPTIYPGIDVVDVWYDGIDSDCDGTNDWDADGDGYDSTLKSDGTDCFDDDPELGPQAYDICNDGIDSDCDGADAICDWTGITDLSAADAKVTGDDREDMLGSQLELVGDWNGDGIAELALGSHEDDTAVSNAGAVFIVYGPPAGTMSAATADVILTGEDKADEAGGYGLARAGDRVGDGIEDLVVGAWKARTGGAAYLVLGGVTGVVSLADSPAVLLGEVAGDFAGRAVSGPGDVTGDGWRDLLIGAKQANSVAAGSGTVYLVAGPVTGEIDLASQSTLLWTGGAEQDSFGGGVAGAGDINGDGMPDMLMDAAGADGEGIDLGAVYLFLGPPTESGDAASLASTIVWGVDDLDGMGEPTGLGDTNDDGYDDFLLSSQEHGSGAEGTAWIVLGPASVSGAASEVAAATFNGVATGDGVRGRGSSGGPEGWGDLNDDGKSDVVLGSPGVDDAGTDAGRIYVLLAPFSGTNDLSVADYYFDGELPGDGAGTCSAAGRDADGDGYNDLIVSAELEGSYDYQAGAVYLLSGQGF